MLQLGRLGERVDEFFPGIYRCYRRRHAITTTRSAGQIPVGHDIGFGERRDVHAALDQGAKLLEGLPKPEHPENHFVFDHTKWIFYAADCYTWLGDDKPAEEHAHEIIAYHTRPDGTSNAPMRSANSHMDLAVIRARHGDLDEAVHHGLAAFGYDRKTEASLLSRAADLDHILSERYPGERLADDFHEHYLAACAALRRRTHSLS